MKSKPQGNKLETSCKDCVFCVYDGKSQVGCEAGRIEAFGDQAFEAYDDEKEFYVINTICNYFRVNGTDIDLEEVKEQCKKTFSLVIYADKITKKNVEKTKKDILNIDYDRDKFNVVVSQHHRDYRERLYAEDLGNRTLIGDFCRDLKDNGINTSVVVFATSKVRDHESFKHAEGSSFCGRISFGQDVPSDIFTKADNAINKDLAKCVFFDYRGVKLVMFMVLNIRYSNYEDYAEFEKDIENEAKLQGLHLKL